LLDGRIPLSLVRRLISVDGWALHGTPVTVQQVIDALVAAGLWALDGDAVVFHDYLTFQPSRDKVEAERKAAAERQQKWKARRNGTTHAVSNAVTEPVTSGCPVPVPDPERTTFSSTTPPTPQTGGWGRGQATGNLRQAALEVVELWNTLVATTGLPAAQPTPSGLTRIQRALREQEDLSWWETQFRRVAASRWCHGDNDNGYTVDLWWVLDKRLEVSSGRYDNKTPKAMEGPDTLPSVAAAAAARLKGSR
jgi:hypothetical protein